MDIRMPVLDGLEATRILRKNKNTSTIPIVAVSASVRTDKEDKKIKSVFNDYLVKPVSITEIVGIIKKYLK
jgi:CheY-like chemotaxis protein